MISIKKINENENKKTMPYVTWFFVTDRELD